jgi:RimJ/RimL family protein N-acetyltransferase
VSTDVTWKKGWALGRLRFGVRPAPPPASPPEPAADPAPAGRPDTELAGFEGVVVSRGRNVCLRTVVPRDLEPIARWAEDAYLARMVGSELLQSYKDVYEHDPSFYEAILTDTTQIVLIVMAPPGFSQPVGFVRLFNIHQSEGYASIETVIGDARASRRGYGVQASRLMGYYGVDVLGLRRLEAKAYQYNTLSINTLMRNGFTHEGTLRGASYRDGRPWDIYLFGILHEEIEEQRRNDKYLLPPG